LRESAARTGCVPKTILHRYEHGENGVAVSAKNFLLNDVTVPELVELVVNT